MTTAQTYSDRLAFMRAQLEAEAAVTPAGLRGRVATLRYYARACHIAERAPFSADPKERGEAVDLLMRSIDLLARSAMQRTEHELEQGVEPA